MMDTTSKGNAIESVPDNDDQEFDWPAPAEGLSIEVLDLAASRDGLPAQDLRARTGPPGAVQAISVDNPELDHSRSRAPSTKSSRTQTARELMRAAPRALTIALVVLATVAVVEGVALTRLGLRRPTAGVSGRVAAAAAPSVTTRPPQPDDHVATIGTRGGDTRAGAAPSTPASARLVIDSEPSGAEVSIDGRAYGTTPVALSDVAPGERRIVLRRGSVQVRQTVVVEAGRTVSILAPMQQVPSTAAGGWLSLSSPVDVDVMEGGNVVGTSRSPQIMLGEGTHTISLVNDGIGYNDKEQVRITAGAVTHLAVKLPQTTIAINALPWAEVAIDGKVVGVTPLGHVPITIGPHEVVFRHPELGEKKMTTVVKAGAPARLSADLRRQ